MILALLQLAPPLPVPVPPPVPVSLDLSTQMIAAAATAIVLVLGALTTGIVTVLKAISELRTIKAGLAQTRALASATHTAVEAAATSIDVIDKNTNGRLAVIEQAHKLLTDKMAEIAAAQLADALAQRDALAAKLAVAEADIVRRADAAPAVPPLPRAVRESDLIR